MAKIYLNEFKKKLDDKNRIEWTNEPKHTNKFKENLREKRTYFRETLDNYIDNDVIKRCDRSYDMCAIKFGPKSFSMQSTLILQEYSKDNEIIITWEYLLFDRKKEEYIESKFFSDSEEAFIYFIDKTQNMIDN